MKKLRIFSIILTAAMALSLVPAGTVFSASDFSGRDNSDIIEFLYAVNLLRETDAFQLDSGITRSQVAVTALRLLGIDTPKSGEPVYFTDVEAGEGVGYVQHAVFLGLMSGYGDGTFRPDRGITYEEALKVFVNALGYEYLANSRGGFPSGYLYAALQLNLNRGISLGMGEPVSNESFAVMLYNAAHADISKRTGFGEAAAYEVLKGHTALSEYHKIIRQTGVMKAADGISLKGDYTGKKTVRIDDKAFEYNEDSYGRYIGYEVRYYYEDSDNRGNLLVYAIPTASNEAVAIKKRDMRDDSTYSKINYHSENSASVKSISISPIADVVYNGVVTEDRDIGKLMMIAPPGQAPLNGKVTLIDNNSDGLYDIVFINAGRTVVVDHVDTNNYVIHDRLNPGSPIDVDPKSSDYKVYIYIGEKPGELADIKGWNALSVEESTDSSGTVTAKRIYVCYDSVAGTIDAASTYNEKDIIVGGMKYTISGDGDIVIDGQEYKISEAYLYALGTNKLNFAPFNEPGHSGVFYLDAYGYVVGGDSSKTGGLKYGYLIGIAEKTGLSGTSTFKLLDTNGKILVLNGAKKIRISVCDTTTGATEEVTYEKTAAIKAVVPQKTLMKYRVNDDGDISEIAVSAQFEVTDAKYNYERMAAVINRGGLISTEKTILNFTVDSIMTFSSKLYIDAATRVLVVTREAENETDFIWTDAGYLTNATDYTVEAYDINQYMRASVLVIYQGVSTPAMVDLLLRPKNLFVVDKSVLMMDEEGEYVTKISGVMTDTYGSSVYATYTADTNSNFYLPNPASGTPDTTSTFDPLTLKRGDALQMFTTGFDRVDSAMRVFRDGEALISSNTPVHAEKTFLYGTVVKVDGGSKYLIANLIPEAIPGQNNYWSLTFNYTSYVLWEGNVVRVADYADIREGDRLFIRDAWSIIRNVLIIRD